MFFATICFLHLLAFIHPNCSILFKSYNTVYVINTFNATYTVPTAHCIFHSVSTYLNQFNKLHRKLCTERMKLQNILVHYNVFRVTVYLINFTNVLHLFAFTHSNNVTFFYKTYNIANLIQLQDALVHYRLLATVSFISQ